MKQTIKRFFLKLILAVFILCVLCGLVVFTISNHVKNKAADHIEYIVTGEVKINPASLSTLKEFDADCILVPQCSLICDGSSTKSRGTPAIPV